MKGSASFLGYKNLQDITHCAENLLDALRENEFSINAEIIDTLFETFDISHKILKGLETSDDEPNIDINTNKTKLENLLNAKGTVGQTVETEVTPTNNVSTDKETIDDELSSLISDHRETEQAPSKEVQKQESGEPELSAAALDSLRELVGEGKVDASLVDELSSPQSEESSEPAIDDSPASTEDVGLSAAALDSLKELGLEAQVELVFL